MRIFSELGTDESLDVMVEIAAPAASIVNDTALIEELRKALPAGTHTQADVYRFAVSKIAVLVPIVLKQHRADLYAILSPFNGKTADEIGKQKFMQTCAEVKMLVCDKELVDFFKSLRGAEQSE